MLGKLANLHALELCDEEGKEVPFGSDEYFDQIVTLDSQGKKFTLQRDAWREGSDFKFSAEFFAKTEPNDSTDNSFISSSSENTGQLDNNSMNGVIDVEAVERS